MNCSYNEQVRDLLNPEPTVVKIQSDGMKVLLSGVREVVVTSPDQVIALLQGGEVYRSISATDMNEHSSRAHSIFKLMVESQLRDPDNGSLNGSQGVLPNHMRCVHYPLQFIALFYS